MLGGPWYAGLCCESQLATAVLSSKEMVEISQEVRTWHSTVGAVKCVNCDDKTTA